MKPPRKMRKRGKVRWLVDLRALKGGRQYFPTEREAKLCFLGALQRNPQVRLPDRMVRRYAAIEAKLSKLGVTLEEVVQHWKDTRLTPSAPV